MKKAYPYPAEFVAFLAEYHGTRDYFECHEIMEEFWKREREKGGRHVGCWLVLTRLSVVQYHARRGNGRGAFKLLSKANAEIDGVLMSEIGLDGERLTAMMRERLAAWGQPEGVRYDDFNLPIREPALREAARRRSAELGAAWQADGMAAGEDVVHRHATRDRTEVEEARAASAQRKALDRRQA
ncbi:DUF309 domain-containing protein [Cohnella sp. REN36]|nr:DUF309 domain-containing protein [Cohnella sp. REN36]